MIIDNFENSKKYYPLNKYFQKAFEYINSTDFNSLECGRYEIDSDNIYANIEEYVTKESSKPEYHKKYIDIQFLARGTEFIGYCPVETLTGKEDFNSEKDIGFGSGAVNFIKIVPKQFMILFPNDAHQPCMAISEPEKVKKVVVKVRAL